jgi:macrophage erythroblast attacher
MLKKNNESPERISAGFQKQIDKMKLLKTKYQTLIDEEEHFYSSLEARTSHLTKIQSDTKDAHMVEDYFELRIERIILDYMLRQGYFESAKAFAATNKINVSRDQKEQRWIK